MTVRVVGVGMGPQHVTPEAAAALAASAYVVAAAKGEGDPLLEVRRAVVEPFGLPVVAVPDPVRDPALPYADAVAAWHAERARRWAAAIRGRSGDPALVVLGDPGLYDSTLRVVEAVAPGLGHDVEVVAGVSAPSLLAARHRTVLHDVGEPVHITTARRLPDDVAAGQRTLVVMLGGEGWESALEPLPDWSIWWGANLGAASESLLTGRVADVRPRIGPARAACREAAGWVLDISLLRAPAERR